jgi:hypothetical protein
VTDEAYDLSVRVTRNDSTVVFARNRTVRASATGSFEDVIDSPGTYTITTTVENGSTATYTATLDGRYSGTGEPEWEIRISGDGDVRIRRIPHQ